MLLHHPLVFAPPQLQQIQPPPPALRKSQFARGQLEVDGWDAANVMFWHAFSYPVSKSISADGQ